MKNSKSPTATLDVSSITTQKTIKPNQPVATLIQEASNLYVWCLDDVEQLSQVGVTGEMINDLLPRIENCQNAQSLWNKKLQSVKESRLKWREEVPKALQLRNDVLSTMRFAFRNNEDLLHRLPLTSKDKGYASLFQGLNDLSFLAKSNTSLLTAVNFDLALIEKLENTSKILRELWAIVKAEENSDDDIMQKRNTAFWHLQELVSEIRKAGKYVFRNNESRYVGYVSPFWKHKNKKKSSNSPS